MCTGLSEDLEAVSDARKTAVIDRELLRLNIDIAALQETRLPSNGSLKEANYTFFWQGLEPTERRLHGVGFAVRNSLLPTMEAPSKETERMLSLRFLCDSGHVSIICAYDYTLSPSAGSAQPDQPLTWSFQFGNCKKNAASKDSHSTWHSSI